MARKSGLTPDIHKQLINVLQGGATIADACAFVGITDRTYHNWIKRGEAGRSEEYVQFFRDATRARVSARIGAVAIIRQAITNGDVSAAEWYLERTDPENWGRRNQSSIKIEGLDELLRLTNKLGISAADVVQEMLNELSSIDADSE